MEENVDTDQVEATPPALKRIRLRYIGVCRVCSADVAAGAWGYYDKVAKKVSCAACIDGQDESEPAPVTADEPAAVEDVSTLAYAEGVGGASARLEHEKRNSRREANVRERHPRLGGLLLAIFDEPQNTKAWSTGAKGEEILAAWLNKAAGPLFRLLHDRKIPGTRANIDHMVICPLGVWVVDAKRYVGKRPDVRYEGGFFRPKIEKLTVAGRDRTNLVEGMHKQVALVSAALEDSEINARGVLCFVEADWPLLVPYFRVQGVDVVSPRKLAEMLGADGPLGEEQIADLHRRLAAAFPPAS